MYRRKLTDSVSIEEMLRMRENGMSNMEIANAVGAGYSTVWKYLGADPGRGGHVSTSIPTQVINLKPRNEKPVEAAEAVYEGVLPVVNRVISLKGEYGEYEVDTKNKKVTFAVGNTVAEIGFDEWAIFAKEVAAIERNVSKIGLSPEIW